MVEVMVEVGALAWVEVMVEVEVGIVAEGVVDVGVDVGVEVGIVVKGVVDVGTWAEVEVEVGANPEDIEMKYKVWEDGKEAFFVESDNPATGLDEAAQNYK